MTINHSSTPQRRSGHTTFIGRLGRWMMCILFAAIFATAASAQTGGEAGIQGTVTDPSGAAVPNATVTATNNATGTVTTRQASGDGLYTIAPILPGTYTVSVKATGFKEYVQQNLSIDALRVTGLNVTLTIGSESSEVTVTEAPPALETTNATLGGVMENQTYENLPLQMSGQQRDPTAFATLLPGTQGGARAPIIGGTGNYLAQVYVDGIPVTTINQQGDNRIVSNALPVESIDQFQVVTSTPDAEYQGAGLINFTLKSGGSQYHGIVAGFVRARAFDAWTFASKTATVKDANGNTVAAPKPDEHQSEFVASGGGPIPFTKKKGYFYVTYDKFHGRTGINPSFLTVPTLKMRSGDFSELLTTVNTPTGCVTGAAGCTTSTVGQIYDPTSVAACTAAHAGTLCRNPFPGNIIPQNYLSPIALKMASFLPAPTNGNLVNNLYGGVPSGFDNWEIAGRADYDLTSKQRLSYILSYGVRKNVPFTVGSNTTPTQAGVVLPLPYTNGGYAKIVPVITDIEHAWQISDHITNQFKYGFNRFAQPVTSLTDGAAGYMATDFGITGLPAGQASTNFPGASFGTTTLFPTTLAQFTANGASGATQTTVPNTYTLLDNFLINKGAHSLTLGIQLQWLQDNVAPQVGPSGIYTVPYSAASTAVLGGGGTPSTTNTGFSYASYLLGAASSSGIGIQAVSETGGRYHDVSPYVQDNWKVTPKLTLNLGLRWDYFPPFHEVLDRWSFLNPNLTNPITGTPGLLQFAGNYGGPGVSCNCRTPVNSYWKNFGPRIGLAYAVTPTTIIRAGFATLYSIGGGVGGRGGAGNGTGQTGFNSTATAPADVTSGAGVGPSYYLNNSTYFQSIGQANTKFGGSNFVLPTNAAPSATTQLLNTGNYINGSGSFVTAGTVSYADPYLSGRAPQINMFNGGIQQALSNSLTLTLNYAGTQSHFLLAGGSNARGYYANQLDPKYLLALGRLADSTGKSPLLAANATPANIALVQAALPGYKVPYAGVVGTASRTTVAQTLVTFPQYSGVSDLWGQNVANINYHSMQASLNMRNYHGLTWTLNYTWSHNIGDDGTFRSGYDLPSGSVDGTTASFKQNRIDRSNTTTDITHNLAAYGFWDLPFGKHSQNWLVRSLASGWQVSGIYRFTSGTPFVISGGGCNSALSGTCEVSYNPNYTGNPRKNGGYRKFNTQYIDPTAFQAPTFLFSYTDPTTKATTLANNLIGNVARTAPFGLRNPYSWNGDASLRRTFPIFERVKFIAEVDCLNVANHTNLGGLTATWGAPGTAAGNAFGTLTSASATPRDFQFAGRITF